MWRIGSACRKPISPMKSVSGKCQAALWSYHAPFSSIAVEGRPQSRLRLARNRAGTSEACDALPFDPCFTFACGVRRRKGVIQWPEHQTGSAEMDCDDEDSNGHP